MSDFRWERLRASLQSPAFRWNQEARDQWVASHAALVPSGSRVLDVGAGPARYRRLFRHCVYHAHDLAKLPRDDGSYQALDFVSDISELPVCDGAYDVVLCTEVLEHIPEPIRALAEIARVLRTGGRLLLSAPLGSWLHQQPFHFYGGFTQFWYARMLPAAGLRIDELAPNGGFFQLFGQEAMRYRQFLHPRSRHFSLRPVHLFATAVWMLFIPLSHLLPRLGKTFDSLNLESIATAGYHVACTKVPHDA
jgi:SAM-dependent methyltransferase